MGVILGAMRISALVLDEIQHGALIMAVPAKS